MKSFSSKLGWAILVGVLAAAIAPSAFARSAAIDPWGWLDQIAALFGSGAP